MNNYKLKGRFVVNIKANSYNEIIDIFNNINNNINNSSGVDEIIHVDVDKIYIDYIIKCDKDGNEIKVYQ